MREKILLVISIIGMILMYYIGLNYSKNNDKNVIEKESIQTNTYNGEIKNEIISIIPNYIAEDLEKYGFESTSFDKNNWEKFKNILKKENIKSEYEKNNILFGSALKGNVDIDKIRELIKLGYDINRTNERGETYLQLLVKNLKNIENVYLIDELIKLGANINVTSDIDVLMNGFNGKMDILNYALANKNADVRNKVLDILSENGMSVRNNPSKYIQAVFINEKFKKQIIENIDMSTKITKDENSFEYLFTKLNSDEISEILKNDSNIDYSYEGTNLLHKIAQSDQVSKKNIKSILELNLNVNANSDFLDLGMTPLQANIFKGDYETIELLLKKGANPYIQDYKGNNSFSYAEKIVKEKENIIKILEKYKNNFKEIN
ncbi:hypothetical protein [Halarcobacter sp.]|uniref:hypothetical protein n=1 Tax=Halarcobacter sp. TaxID=2321133 RepID=UPI002AA7D92D|nr:hypothetical protein [Halarcobacter sp.]